MLLDEYAPHNDALNDEEIVRVAYDEGPLPLDRRAHLEGCATCQQRMRDYRDLHQRLVAKLYRRLCPDAVQLNYYGLGVLSPEERTSIASHLLDCPLCADEMREIRRTMAAFEPFPSQPSPLHNAVRRIMATLVVQQARPVIVRGEDPAGVSWPRQYRAESIDLSLHLSHTSHGETMLLGIITSSDKMEVVDAFEGARVELYRFPAPCAEDHEVPRPLPAIALETPFLVTEIDDVGNILLEPVPEGSYRLIVHLPDREVAINDLTI